MQSVKKSTLNSLIINDLSRCVDATRLVQAYQHPKKNSRLYAYSDVIREACAECFRWRDGEVYVFDGQVWVTYDVDLLKYCLRDALVGVVSAAPAAVSAWGVETIKSDWVDCEKKLMGYAMDGIKSSPLVYNNSLVGFSNGVWDFSDMRNPVKHGFGDRIGVTSLLPYRYDENAVCPTWLRFLSAMLTPGDVEVLQKFMALGCVDRKNLGQSIEESLWLIGDGANGKTTIQNVIRMVFGEWNVSSARLDSLLDSNIDARLRATGTIVGKVFNMCQEISSSNVERGADMFKSLVSGENQQYRDIGRNIHDTADIPYFIFSMNQMPANKRMDKAFVRRMVRIDFRSSVKREDMDRGLLAKLASELSGIRNWVIQGWTKLERDNFSIKGGDSKDGRMTDEEIEMHIANGLTVDVWLSEWAQLSPSRHVGHDDDEVGLEIKATELYNDYVDYCQNKIMCEPSKGNAFGRQMHDRLHFESHRKAGGMYYKVWCDKISRFNKQ